MARTQAIKSAMDDNEFAKVVAAAKAAKVSVAKFLRDAALEKATGTHTVRVRVVQQRGTDYWTYQVLDEHGGMYLASGPFHTDIDARKNAEGLFGGRVEWL